MIEFIRYMHACALAYYRPHEGQAIEPAGVTYFALTSHSVPKFTCLIGRGRDAWIVTQLALEHALTRREMEKRIVEPL